MSKLNSVRRVDRAEVMSSLDDIESGLQVRDDLRRTRVSSATEQLATVIKHLSVEPGAPSCAGQMLPLVYAKRVIGDLSIFNCVIRLAW